MTNILSWQSRLGAAVAFCLFYSRTLAFHFLSPTVPIHLKRTPQLYSTASNGDPEPLSVVVVGGGWAGFSAADAISGFGEHVKVHVLDASPRGPGGLAGGWKTPTGRSVEAGIHGFWRDYKNTFATMERIGLDLDQVLTPYTPSILVSSSGRVAVAPVLGQEEDNSQEASISINSLVNLLPSLLTEPEQALKEVASLLPPPLDVAILTEFEDKSRLSILDRISGLGLVGAWADFGQEDRPSWMRYDKISAENLFCHVAAVSPRLYQEVVSPLLHVLPMTPGYDCSAAAALSCFHVFALQSKGSFDVKWCRGSITDYIFNPWADKLQNQRGNVDIRGGSKVTSIDQMQGTSEFEKAYKVTINDGKETIDCDAVVLAVGATTAGRLAQSCPALESMEGLGRKWRNLRGVTCVAVRVYVDPILGRRISECMTESPVVVCGPKIGEIPLLAETGFCIYDLARLQDDFQVDEGDKESLCAFEIDFFRANDLADQDDEEVLKVTLQAMAAALDFPGLSSSTSVIEDSSVFRARNAVSHFCVGSAELSPPARLKKGLYVCGDWVDRTGHASWSTEKSVTTGLQAAKAFGSDFACSSDIQIIPANSETPQAYSVLQQIASLLRKAVPNSQDVPPAPWVLVSRLLGR